MGDIVRLLIPVFSISLLGASGPPQDGRTRAGLIAGYEKGLADWDQDADGRLSKAEWMKMTVTGLGREVVGRDEAAFFDAIDDDKDGFLTRQELLRLPLATFDCMDRNADGVLAPEEISLGNCPSYDWDKRAIIRH